MEMLRCATHSTLKSDTSVQQLQFAREQEEKRMLGLRAATERNQLKRKQEEERQDGKKRRKGMFRIVVLCLFLYISHVLLNLMYSFPSLK